MLATINRRLSVYRHHFSDLSVVNAILLISMCSLLCADVVKTPSGINIAKMSATPDSDINGDETNTCWKSSCLPEDLSIHAAHITEVHNVPMRVLIRPIPSILDEDKVLSLMKTIQDEQSRDAVPPIDVLWIKGRQGGDYYFSFGGCHRYEAYKRLQMETIPCKLFKSSVKDLQVYLGSSTPDLL